MKALVEKHFDELAPEYDSFKRKNAYYYSTLIDFFRERVPQGKSVLEVGCATGEIIAALKPGRGKGIDLSQQMVNLAREKNPSIEFAKDDITSLKLEEKFDFVVMADVIDHLFDLDSALNQLTKVMHGQTKVLVSTINPVWSLPLTAAEKLKLKMPEGPNQWVSAAAFRRLCRQNNLAVTEEHYRLLLPKQIPLLSRAVNSLVHRLPLLNRLCLVQFFVVEPIENQRK